MDEYGGVFASDAGNCWPERLRRGVRSVLRANGISQSEWAGYGLDVHHIVAAALDGALPGRRVLSRWSLSVHDLCNAAIVPRTFHRGQGLHRQEFLQIINGRVASADVFAEALMRHGGFEAGRLIMIQTIQKIGDELVLRSGDSVALRLQSALQGLLNGSAAAAGNVTRTRPGRTRVASRVVREGSRAAGEGADRADATLLGSRRFGVQFAPACS